MLCKVSSQPGYPNPSISSFGIAFPRNIHPKTVIYHPEPPYSSLQPHGMAVVFHTGVLPISREFWQINESIGLNPRYLLPERSFHFFGIYTFKSKLQKKASFSILPVAML